MVSKGIARVSLIRIKPATLVTVVSITVGMVLAGFGFMRAFGSVEARVDAMQGEQQTVQSAVDDLKGDVGRLAVEQSATTEALKGVKEQQVLDRDHFDGRLDDILNRLP